MAPNQQGRRDRVDQPVGDVAAAQHSGAAEHREHREQGHEGVVARLLRVPDQQGRDRAEQRCGEPGAAVVELVPERVERGDHEGSGHDRRQPHGEVGVPEHVDRGPQRQGVQRRVPIGLRQVLDELGESEVRLVNADGLVQPQPPRDGDAHGQAERRKRRHDQAGGPRVWLATAAGQRAGVDRQRPAVAAPRPAGRQGQPAPSADRSRHQTAPVTGIALHLNPARRDV